MIRCLKLYTKMLTKSLLIQQKELKKPKEEDPQLTPNQTNQTPYSEHEGYEK